jgi:hypothetical protein
MAVAVLRLLAVGLSLLQLASSAAETALSTGSEHRQATAITQPFSVDDAPDTPTEPMTPPTLMLLSEDTEGFGVAPAAGVTEVVSMA